MNLSDRPDAAHDALDLAEVFGPMSAMHAALDRAGAGMPCGVVARFRGRTEVEVRAAIAAAIVHFPVLHNRIAWIAARPVLLPLRPEDSGDLSVRRISLTFSPSAQGPPWRYALHVVGKDVWFTAVWAHAVADGRSMLHFLQTVAAAIEARPNPIRAAGRGRIPASPMAGWLARFLVERHMAYVKPRKKLRGEPGLSWLVLPPGVAAKAVDPSRGGTAGFAARLSAAACMAFCEQQRGVLAGRVSLDLLASRGNVGALGGFGFAAGSLLIPVKLTPRSTMAAVARRIHHRQGVMLAQGWDQNLQRFVGGHPARRRLFAALEARGLSAPMISVSWKGLYPDLGHGGDMDGVACFAASGVAHVSAHVDANGLSISVTSRLPRSGREDLLARIAARIGERPTGPPRDLEDLWDSEARPDRLAA